MDTADESIEEQTEVDLVAVKDIGEIVVKVFRVKVIARRSLNSSRNAIRNFKASGPYAVGEKALKGRSVTHVIG